MEKMSRMIDTRKGIRQPQALKSSGVIFTRQIPMTISASSRPSVAVVWIQLVS